jgi:hypothetical protein
VNNDGKNFSGTADSRRDVWQCGGIRTSLHILVLAGVALMFSMNHIVVAIRDDRCFEVRSTSPRLNCAIHYARCSEVVKLELKVHMRGAFDTRKCDSFP